MAQNIPRVVQVAQSAATIPDTALRRNEPEVIRPNVWVPRDEPRYRNTVLTYITYFVAIAAALFGGAVATWGLTKLAPGAELVVFVMGAIFEAGKLTSFALVHERVPFHYKGVLILVGAVLMLFNVAGVSGFLSNSYEREATANRAASHASTEAAGASSEVMDRQLKAAEKAVQDARQAVLKAKDDKGRAKAAQAALKDALAAQDELVAKFATAAGKKADAEGAAIANTAETAAITFLATATDKSESFIAHLFILVMASIPDLLAVFLLLSAPHTRRRIG